MVRAMPNALPRAAAALAALALLPACETLSLALPQAQPASSAAAPAAARSAPGGVYLHGGGSQERAFYAALVEAAGRSPTVCTLHPTAASVPPDAPPPRSWERRFAADGAGASALSACTAVYLADAPAGAWSAAMRPGGADTPLMAELRRRVAAGTPVGAAGGAAAAAAAAAPSDELPADSVEALSAPAPRATPGLGLVPGALVEPYFVQDGRLGRQLAAMRAIAAPVGLGIDDGAVVRVPPGGEPWEVRGDRPVVLVQRPEGAEGTTGMRLSLLWPGDRFDPSRGAVLPSPGRRPVGAEAAASRPLARTDVFEPGALAELAERLAASSSGRAIGRAAEGRVRVTLRKTDGTRVHGDGQRLTVAGLGLDLETTGDLARAAPAAPAPLPPVPAAGLTAPPVPAAADSAPPVPAATSPTPAAPAAAPVAPAPAVQAPVVAAPTVVDRRAPQPTPPRAAEPATSRRAAVVPAARPAREAASPPAVPSPAPRDAAREPAAVPAPRPARGVPAASAPVPAPRPEARTDPGPARAVPLPAPAGPARAGG
jgi:hypothetical protein